MNERRRLSSHAAVILVLAMLALLAGTVAVVLALLEIHHALG